MRKMTCAVNFSRETGHNKNKNKADKTIPKYPPCLGNTYSVPPLEFKNIFYCI